MSKKIKITEEERLEFNRQSMIKEVKERVENGYIPKNPTRLFKVGDSVKIGNLQNITVTEVLFDGLAYYVHYDYMGESYGKPSRNIGDGLWDWTSVFPMQSFCEGEIMREKDDIKIRYYNNDIGSLLHKVYHGGVDFNPDYQRDLVWSMAQKLSLMDSIFSNIEIGKFTFILYDYSIKKNFYYEILDGKQRLSTILEFYEDRFSWRGKKLSEMCFQDAQHFTSFPIIQGEVGDITEQQIYRLFIKMNTSGMPQSKEHLEKIKSLIK
jgi:hypothetical protein